MRILVAFDKFKDSLTAPEACAVAAREISQLRPHWEIDEAPLTDGGEGFAELLTRQLHGERMGVPTTGPRQAPVEALIGLVDWRQVPGEARDLLDLPALGTGERIAVVEMAAASGLGLLQPAERDPWQTTTVGTGTLLRAAAAKGVKAIVLGVGGSATNDLGLGALSVLGLEFRDTAGHGLAPPVPAVWPQITAIAGRIDPALPPLRIACDVTNPLLGAGGAATVFGPQKGLPAADVARLDSEAERLARMLCRHCGQPLALTGTAGAGAAGGLAFGLLATGRAQLVPGFPLFRAWCEIDRRVTAADLVLTGEGCFDATSLLGKGPGALLAAAHTAGRRTIILAGKVGAAPEGGWPTGARPQSITPDGLPLAQALREAPARLAAAVRTALSGID